MLLACLVAFTNKNLFTGGAKEALPYIQMFANDFSFNKMSVSQWRYLDYFDQVLLHGFIPLSRSLTLSKVVIMNDPDEALEDAEEGLES